MGIKWPIQLTGLPLHSPPPEKAHSAASVPIPLCPILFPREKRERTPLLPPPPVAFLKRLFSPRKRCLPHQAALGTGRGQQGWSGALHASLPGRALACSLYTSLPPHLAPKETEARRVHTRPTTLLPGQSSVPQNPSAVIGPKPGSPPSPALKSQGPVLSSSVTWKG